MKREFSPEAERFYARVKADQDAKATEQANKPTATTTVTARYLAIGGAHVTVNLGGDRCPHAQIDVEHATVFGVACDACGDLLVSCVANFLDCDESALAEAHAVAQDHAETCRRIPERLWLEDGAR